MDTNDAQAYKGIPVAMPICEYGDWVQYAPLVGDITIDTVVYDTNDGHPGGTYSHYSEEKLLTKLRALIEKPANYKNLLKNTQKLYDDANVTILDKVVTPKNPKKLTKEEKEKLLKWLLSPAGFKAGLSYNGGEVGEYVLKMCEYAEIPCYQEYFTEMHRGLGQRVIAFGETGKKLTAKEHKQFKAHCHDIECWHNSYVYDIHAPTHSEFQVIIDEAFDFGDKGNKEQIKNIEKSIDKLLNNKTGEYEVTVGYGVTINERAPSQVEFDKKKKIKIVVKTLKEATNLAVYWSKFGHTADVDRVKEKV